MKKIFILLLCAAGFSAAFADDEPDSIIRVAILENVLNFSLSCDGRFALVELETGKRTSFGNKEKLSARGSGDGLLVEGKLYKLPLRAVSLDKNKFMIADGRHYRDSLLIRKASRGGVHVINELGLDGYVNGILPREVSASWPREALKAQAVASRTYALRNLHRHDSEGFHLCATVHCQVFGGLESEKEETSQAVADTHNEIALYHDEPAETYFFSNCGGYTEDPKYVWEKSDAPRYLKCVRCRYCKSGGHFEWEREVSGANIIAALSNKYEVTAPLHSIKISSKSRSGRALAFTVLHDDGSIKIPSSRFRMLLGPEVVRSTLIRKIKKSGSGFIFEGRGWGHGVGMCQEGARSLALKGKKYKKIIAFYYPGVKIKKFED